MKSKKRDFNSLRHAVIKKILERAVQRAHFVQAIKCNFKSKFRLTLPSSSQHSSNFLSIPWKMLLSINLNSRNSRKYFHFTFFFLHESRGRKTKKKKENFFIQIFFWKEFSSHICLHLVKCSTCVLFLF